MDLGSTVLPRERRDESEPELGHHLTAVTNGQEDIGWLHLLIVSYMHPFPSPEHLRCGPVPSAGAIQGPSDHWELQALMPVLPAPS